MNWYEEKQQRRKERLEERADRLAREGRAKVDSGMDRLRAIPFGQPILVGHHSEQRDRNYRRKAVGAVDKGIELQQAAADVARRAEAVGSGGVSSDDPDAVDKLAEKLEGLKALQARMIAANKVVRKFKGKDQAAGVAALVAQGFTESSAAKLFEPDFCGRVGFASYELTNNGANIRRIEQRIEHLKRNATRETKVEAFGAIKLVENAEINRVQIIFPGKPSADVRGKLKASGFRWSPSEGAWQRQLNNAAVYWAKDLITKLNSEGEKDGQ